MRRFNTLIAVGLLLGGMPPAQAQQTSDLERVHAASRQFVAAIVARDINAMDAVWAHESYASFVGPLSTRWWSAREAYGRPGKCALVSSIASPSRRKHHTFALMGRQPGPSEWKRSNCCARMARR
jgi:hypothetical protein